MGDSPPPVILFLGSALVGGKCLISFTFLYDFIPSLIIFLVKSFIYLFSLTRHILCDRDSVGCMGGVECSLGL